MQIFHKNLFTILTVLFVILMPFYVLIKVFFEYQLGIAYFGAFIKEGIVVGLGCLLIYEYWKARRCPKVDLLDILILAYFSYGIIITVLNGLGFAEIFHGGRYDFMFLGIFLIMRHGVDFLQISFSHLLKIFIWSASISMFLGVLLRVIGEEFLTLFGYDYYRGNWVFQGSVPIYHGVESSGIRRFQGLLDGPNQMAFFLFVYGAAVFWFVKKRLQFHHGLIALFLFIALLLTFSRSALLGLGTGVFLLILMKASLLWKHYRKECLVGLALMICVVGGGLAFFERKIESIIIREGSTQGHFERMEIGVDRFLEQPLGHGLATSGPAFRQVFDGQLTKEVEKQYIPESWFIQQLVEGGVIYFSLFCLILILILLRVYPQSPSFFIACIAIGVMNVFLHIFEATYVSLVLFLFLALLISKKHA